MLSFTRSNSIVDFLSRVADGLRRWSMGVLATCLLATTGCQPTSDINRVYGQRDGLGSSSINGTVVLSELFEAAGYETSSWGRLSPKLERENVIVLTPDRYYGPYEEEADYLEQWLANQPNRTLVYIARDYDATVDYWKQVLDRSSPEQRLRIRVQLAKAMASERSTAEPFNLRDSQWYKTGVEKNYRDIEDFTGIWTEDVDDGMSIPLRREITPLERDGITARTLLGENGGAGLVFELSRPEWGNSKLLLVTNGSFLLNLPLTDAGNRRLATRLVESCGAPGRVCFLECDEAPMMVTTSDRSPPFFLQLFTTFPVNLIVFHLCLLGMVYCLYIFPIFGRPRTLPDGQVSDFGKHVAALGEMLERTGDEEFASEKIEQYQTEVET